MVEFPRHKPQNHAANPEYADNGNGDGVQRIVQIIGWVDAGRLAGWSLQLFDSIPGLDLLHRAVNHQQDVEAAEAHDLDDVPEAKRIDGQDELVDDGKDVEGEEGRDGARVDEAEDGFQAKERRDHHALIGGVRGQGVLEQSKRISAAHGSEGAKQPAVDAHASRPMTARPCTKVTKVKVHVQAELGMYMMLRRLLAPEAPVT